MSLRASDRSLRRLVAELATASPEDLEGVLDQLSDPHRETVRAMLATYLGEGDDGPQLSEPSVPPSQVPRLDGLSRWLQARIGTGPDPRNEADRPFAFLKPRDEFGRDAGLTFNMTSSALEALRSCAADLTPSPPSSQPPEPPAKGLRSWLEGVLGASRASVSPS